MSYIAAEDVAKAKEMEKYITDERTGLKYELVGDYYLVVGDDEPEEDQPIRIWGQRHLRHLKRRHKVIYANLLTSGKLPEYLADTGSGVCCPGRRATALPAASTR